jgi:AmmeMemoRadiSam system protein A
MEKIICSFFLCILLAANAMAENNKKESSPGTKTEAREFNIKEEKMKIQEHKSGTWDAGLSDQEKSTLFAIAKDTLAWCVERKSEKFPIEKYELTPKLKANTATFVTLKIKGELRGCIGSLAPEEPLYMSVHHNAVNAAMHDYRFQPVSKEELSDITVDVSILSPIRDIPSLNEFKLGEQGIILEKAMRRAVFLPEVAKEQKWTKEETLTHLALKAGLQPDAWKKDAHFQVFESVVLSISREK